MFQFVELTNNYPCFWQVKVVADQNLFSGSSVGRTRVKSFVGSYANSITPMNQNIVAVSTGHDPVPPA